MTKATIKRALVKLGTGRMTPAQLVKFTRDTNATAKTSPAFLASPAAQGFMTTWVAAADAVEKNETEITKAETVVVTLRGQEVQLVFGCQVAAADFAGSVETLANGDPEVVKAMGLGLRTPGQPVVEIAAPLGLKLATSRLGVVSLHWDTVPGARLYVMQLSVDPATDASWVTVAGGGRSRKLVGLVHGQKYLLRVMAKGARIDGPWSTVLGYTAK